MVAFETLAVLMQNGAVEEVETMNMEFSSGELLPCNNSLSTFQILHLNYHRFSVFLFFFTSISRCKIQSIHHCTSAHPCLVYWERRARWTPPLSTRFSWNVRLAASDRQPRRLRLQPAGTFDRRTLRGSPVLRTLPRLWRHSRRPERQQLQTARGRHRPPLPWLINESAKTSFWERLLWQ